MAHHIKTAFRNLWRNRLYSFLNIGGLALGMATAVLLMLWVQNEFSYETYHQKAKNLYRVNTEFKVSENDTWHWSNVPMKLAEKLKAEMPEIKETTRLYVPYGDFSIKLDEDVIGESNVAFIDKNWFEVFDYQFVMGSNKAFQKDKNNIAITESRAKKFFGDENPIGKIIKHDSLNFVVSAVLKDLPSNSSFRFQFFAQNEVRMTNPADKKNDEDWGNYNYQTFVVCNENTNTQFLSDKITKNFQKIREEKDNSTKLSLSPVTSIHFDEQYRDDNLTHGEKKITYIFSIIAIIILLIACINYVNLTTAQASLRAKEVGIKKLIGASSGSLFNQFFIESALTSMIALGLSIILVQIALPNLENIVENKFSLVENPIIWLIFGLSTLFSIIFTGIYPSILLSSFQPIKVLKGFNIGGSKSSDFRKSLVVFQFTFTIILLIGTFVIYKQLRFIQTKQLGYNKEQVFSFAIPWFASKSGKANLTIFERLKTESTIKNVALSNMNIVEMNSTHSGSLNWKGKDPKFSPTVSQMAVSANYQQFFDLKMTDGRWFKEGNVADEKNVILNETAIKEFNIPKPVVGQSFEFHGNKGQIVGIAKDFHFRSPKEKITPLVVFRSGNWLSTFFVKTEPMQVSNAISTTEKIWKEILPNQPFKYEFLDQTYENLHRAEQKQLMLFNVFAFIVLLISCFGLFGLATFTAETRIKEIGIRKVLGASIAGIVGLLSKDFIKLVLVAIVLASPVAWWLVNQWLQNFAYKIEVRWWMFALSGVFALLIALLTVSYQSIRAALANPTESLKVE